MFVNIDGLRINYKITGDGEKTVAILQGWGTTLEVYDLIAMHLSGKYKVIQFDFPGFGGSDEPKEPWAVDDFTVFFIKLMDAIDCKPDILMGHSYGGRVIIKLLTCFEHSFSIEKVILIDSAGIMPKRSMGQKLKVRKYKMLKAVFSIPPIKMLFPEMIEDWKSRQGSADYRNASPIMRATLVKSVNEDLAHLLEKIPCEVLLIWGDKDTATPIEDARIMEKAILDCGLAVIPGAGHYSFLDAPVVFKNILSSYLLEGK